MKKYKIGYTQGVYDMFHIGHLNVLEKAKEQCEFLIVGINSDKLVKEYKSKKTVINEIDRMEIVKNIKHVDKVILTHTLDKTTLHKELKFDAIFIGSDWKEDKRWISTVAKMKEYNVDVVFLPHTDGVTSTMLRKVLDKKVGE